MPRPLLAAKLRNQIKTLDSDLVVTLKNIRVNDSALGCSGFVTNPNTGAVTYVNTDNNRGRTTRALFRTAENERDFRGGINKFAEYDDLAEEVVNLANRAV